MERKVSINTEPKYEVAIGYGNRFQIGERLKALKPRLGQVVVISDETVFSFYGEGILESLKAVGFEVRKILFPAGEQSKTPENLLAIIEQLASWKVTRSDTLVALGGGVIGDLVGFAAATYLRGMDFVQVPTSLLAAVDSSVGGKTAVNLPQGKNLWGAFKQPLAVFCDLETLESLPEVEFTNGLAEVIKYAFIGNPQLKALLKKGPLHKQNPELQEIVTLCVAQKAEIVAADEKDLGVRQLLNFGHTFAHGIEKGSHYEIKHGYAVALGMFKITQGAVHEGITSPEILAELKEILSQNGFPLTCSVSEKDILEAVSHDKKSRGSEITLVLPQAEKCILKTIQIKDMPLFLGKEGIQ